MDERFNDKIFLILNIQLSLTHQTYTLSFHLLYEYHHSFITVKKHSFQVWYHLDCSASIAAIKSAFFIADIFGIPKALAIYLRFATV